MTSKFNYRISDSTAKIQSVMSNISVEACTRLSLAERYFLGENDRANAVRLASALGRDVLFVPGRGWAVWDGSRFDFAAGLDRARGVCAKLADLIEEEATAIRLHRISDTEAAAISEEAYLTQKAQYINPANVQAMLPKHRSARHRMFAEQCANLSRIKPAMELLRSIVHTDGRTLDARPELLNCTNGTVDLSALEATNAISVADIDAFGSGFLSKHCPDVLLTKQTRAPFKPGAPGSAWQRFIETVQPDPEMRAYLQRLLGLSVFGQNIEQIAIFLVGEGGNGKSTLMNVIGQVLGDHAAPCKIEILLESRTQSAGAANPEELALPGARLILCTEPDRADRLSTKKLKAFTGGDPRPIRAPYAEQEFLYVPSGIPVITCNRTPRIDVEDHGTARRLVFVPFPARLDRLPHGVRRDQNTIERELLLEAPAILNWLIDGYLAYRVRGIDAPGDAVELRRALFSRSDPVSEFLAETCRAADGRILKQELYTAFSAWTDAAMISAPSREEFNRGVAEKGFATRKTNGGRLFWEGIAWHTSDRNSANI